MLSCGATFIAYLTALLAYLYLKYTAPGYNEGGGYYPIVMAAAFCIGLQIANTTVVPLSSGVATLFVATAHNPEVLRDHFPALYAEMARVSHPLALRSRSCLTISVLSTSHARYSLGLFVLAFCDILLRTSVILKIILPGCAHFATDL